MTYKTVSPMGVKAKNLYAHHRSRDIFGIFEIKSSSPDLSLLWIQSFKQSKYLYYEETEVKREKQNHRRNKQCCCRKNEKKIEKMHKY